MLFTDVINLITEGKKITREHWSDHRHYILMKDYLVCLHKAGEKEEDVHPWIISEEDLLGEDWLIL